MLRDSAQVATRVRQAECGPDLANALGLAETRDHCATDCEAGNGVTGRLATPGFPSPVPAASRLAPRTSADGVNSPITTP